MGINVNHRWEIVYTNGRNLEAERIEQEVFEERFGYHQQLWESEYKRFDNQSVWITLSHGGKLVGAIRAIVGEPEKLKFSDDITRFWFRDWSEVATSIGLGANSYPIECATLSVLPEYRNYDSSWPVKALCGAFGNFVLDSGATHCVQMLDPKVRKLLCIVLQLPFEVVPGFEPIDFHGLLVPVFSNVSQHSLILKTRCADFESFYFRRNETVKGGTKLPAIDDSNNGPTRLHQNLLNIRTRTKVFG